MNILSWLLYAADVSDNASNICRFLLTAIPLSVPLTGLLCGAYNSECVKGNEITLVRFLSFYKKFIPYYIVCAVLTLVTPSKETVYLIAASEMGQEAFDTEIAQDVRDYVKSLADGARRNNEK